LWAKEEVVFFREITFLNALSDFFREKKIVSTHFSRKDASFDVWLQSSCYKW